MDVDPSNSIDLSIFAGLQGRMWLIENQCKCFVEPLFKMRSSVSDLLKIFFFLILKSSLLGT